MPSIRKWDGNTWINSNQRVWDGEKWDYNYLTPLKWNGKEWSYYDLNEDGSISSSSYIDGSTKRFVNIYSPTWTGVYDGSYREIYFTQGLLYHGDSKGGNSKHGNQSSLIGFDYEKIQKDLVGAKIIKVELFLSNVDSNESRGSKAMIATNNLSEKPTYGEFNVHSGNYEYVFPYKKATWVELPKYVASSFSYGIAKGLSIKGPFLNRDNYGAYEGRGANAPKLRITFDMLIDKNDNALIPYNDENYMRLYGGKPDDDGLTISEHLLNHQRRYNKEKNDKPPIFLNTPLYYTVPSGYDLKKVTEHLLNKGWIEGDFYEARRKLMDLNNFSTTAPVLKVGDKIMYREAKYI